jgi:hypothetical protein
VVKARTRLEAIHKAYAKIIGARKPPSPRWIAWNVKEVKHLLDD